MLREAKKLRKELRALLEDARTRVAELETQVLDGKLEIDSLKASPVVSDEVDCADCPIFLANLTALREKHASNCEELDVLRVELVELQSRPTLLGACTCQMVRSGQPTWVLIPMVYLFGGEESKAKNSKVAHEYAEHREHGEFILVRASGE
jgi:hypothetical protein